MSTPNKFDVVTQELLEVSTQQDPFDRVSQVVAETFNDTSRLSRVSQELLEASVHEAPFSRVSQVVVEVLVKSGRRRTFMSFY